MDSDVDSDEEPAVMAQAVPSQYDSRYDVDMGHSGPGSPRAAHAGAGHGILEFDPNRPEPTIDPAPRMGSTMPLNEATLRSQLRIQEERTRLQRIRHVNELRNQQAVHRIGRASARSSVDTALTDHTHTRHEFADHKRGVSVQAARLHGAQQLYQARHKADKQHQQILHKVEEAQRREQNKRITRLEAELRKRSSQMLTRSTIEPVHDLGLESDLYEHEATNEPDDMDIDVVVGRPSRQLGASPYQWRKGKAPVYHPKSDLPDISSLSEKDLVYIGEHMERYYRVDRTSSPEAFWDSANGTPYWVLKDRDATDPRWHPELTLNDTTYVLRRMFSANAVHSYARARVTEVHWIPRPNTRVGKVQISITQSISAKDAQEAIRDN